ITLALPLAALLAVSPLQAGWKGGKLGAGGQGNTGTQVTTALSDAEAATLVFMREEEKLARDVYITLYDQWEHPVCRVPCDYIPKRSYPLFRTRQILNDWLTQNLEEA
ncbi:DUF2202 domain-containing protein, partial [Thiolapillus sp.]|uniref:DUF2202 domain-containing protein n=1 Tax=Thiolapillus sp. TaxID=2017437 RepID=UPI003AF6B59B